jgi:hypothetical protein
MFFRYDQDRGDRFDGMRIDDPHPDQLPPEWIYDPVAGITLTVLVEADTAEAANARARAIGIDFAPENIGMPGLNRTWGMQPTLLHRWVEVGHDSWGFDDPMEALGDSTSYGLFNPWTVDSCFYSWPVFIHYENDRFEGAEAFVLWRSEHDRRPVE